MNRVSIAIMLVPIVAIVVGATIAVFRPSFDAISIAAYQRIQVGMSERDVKALIGNPRAASAAEELEMLRHRIRSVNAPLPPGDAVDGLPRPDDTVRSIEWYGRRGAITIGFDRKGCVTWKYFAAFDHDLFWGRFLLSR